jgi:hypothetical protein
MNNELFIVMDGSKVAGIYRWRDDAESHAQICGGRLVIQSIRESLPSWVQVMVDEAKNKARMQSAGR